MFFEQCFRLIRVSLNGADSTTAAAGAMSRRRGILLVGSQAVIAQNIRTHIPKECGWSGDEVGESPAFGVQGMFLRRYTCWRITGAARLFICK